MADIVVTPITAGDRKRWAELWHGYLDFYETRLPPEIYDHTWQRLVAAESPVRGLGARLGTETAPLIGIVHYLFHAHAWIRARSATCRICLSTRRSAGKAA